MVKPAARREAVQWIRNRFGASQRRPCGLASCTVSVVRSVPRRDAQERLRAQLREPAGKRPRYGYRRLTWLLRRAGEAVNPNRIYGLYRLEGSAIRERKRKKLTRSASPPPEPPTAPNARWNMDFMEDSVARSRKIRTLNVPDQYSRECLVIEVDTSLSGARVCRTLDRLAQARGVPGQITVDNGSEYTSVALGQWAADHGVDLRFSRPGKPTDNPFIESFNGKFRDECLNENWFLGLGDARRIIEVWRKENKKKGRTCPSGCGRRRSLRRSARLRLPARHKLRGGPSTRRSSHNRCAQGRGLASLSKF
ncbi:MAG: IS3 family transposase [Thermoanaerobaculia bacterium]